MNKKFGILVTVIGGLSICFGTKLVNEPYSTALPPYQATAITSMTQIPSRTDDQIEEPNKQKIQREHPAPILPWNEIIKDLTYYFT